MVRAHLERSDVGNEAVFRSFSGNQRILGTGAGSGFQGAGDRVLGEHVGHRIDAAWKRRRRVRHVQDGFSDRIIAANHIAVYDGFHALYYFRMLREVCHCAIDLRRPDEPDCATRRLKLAASNQRGQSASSFQDRRGARCVVVGAGLLMTEVTGKNDLLARAVRAGNDGADDFVVARFHLCSYNCVKRDLLAAREPSLVLSRAAKRNHEREFIVGVVRREVSPTHIVDVVARPARHLILLIAENAGGAALIAGQLVNCRNSTASKHDAALYLFAIVVLRRSACADVNQRCGDIRAP